MLWHEEKELLKLSQILGEDERAGRLVRLALLHPEKTGQVLRSLRALLVEHGYDPARLPAFLEGFAENGEDTLHFGTVMIGDREAGQLRLSLKNFLASHTLLAAETQWGKSSYLKYLIEQIINLGHRVCIFDSEGEYWDLVPVLGPDKIWNIEAHADRDNPLEPPPGIPVRHWVAAWKRIVRELFYCREGMMNLCDDVLRNLYGNLDSDQSGRFPTIGDVVTHLEKMRFRTGTRHAGFHESLLDRMKSLWEGLSDSLSCMRGFPQEELLKRSLIYDISVLSQEFKLFVLHMKLLRILMLRERQLETCPEIGGPAGTDLLVIEEAHRSMAKVYERRLDLGEPFLYDSLRSGAKRGARLWFVEQLLATVPDPVLGNIGNLIIGKLNDGPSLRTLVQVTGWSREQLDQIRELPPRHFVIRTSALPDGALVKVPEL